MTNDQDSAAAGTAELADALKSTEGLIEGIRPDQLHAPTPCDDFDVTALVAHLLGYAARFADQANGVTPVTDAEAVEVGSDPAAAYREVADRLVGGYSGTPGEEAPPLGIVLMETMTHGWDLAAATGQSVSYPDTAIASVHALGQQMMSPDYRGDDKPFGLEVDVPDTAPPLERLVGFMGRDPAWSA
jgi:uncharacterized protein (TIGR03086 family)